VPLDIKRESLSSRKTITDTASLYVSPRQAEPFLERWVNLDVGNPGKVEQFRKRFAGLLPRFSTLDFSLRAITSSEKADVYFWVHARTQLRALWEQPNLLHKKKMLLLLAASYMEECVEQGEEDRFPLVLLYAIEHAHLLRYCLNPKCAEPYFVARRGSQIYCSEPCAEPAKREAKLRWWHQHRANRRAKTRKKRGKHAQTTAA
jgi:hypothetical protein